MFAKMQNPQRLVVLVVCHGLTVGQIISHYFLVQRPMPWLRAQEFCQRHYVDLAILSTEAQYLTLLSATAANNISFWLGLRYQSTLNVWAWVNGDELSYEHWYKRNPGGHCASLEAMLEKDQKLLARYCDELHMSVCQGPVSPDSVMSSVGANHVNLSWNVSAFMQMTPHSYNVTTCASTCDIHLYPYTPGSTNMNINISNLTPSTEYFIKVVALVVRRDSGTGGEIILQSNPAALQVKTVDSAEQCRLIIIILKLLKLVFLVPPLWVLYHILKNRFLPSCKNMNMLK